MTNHHQEILVHEIKISGQKGPALIYSLRERLNNALDNKRRIPRETYHLSVNKGKKSILVYLKSELNRETLESVLNEVIEHNEWNCKYEIETYTQPTNKEIGQLTRELDKSRSELSVSQKYMQQLQTTLQQTTERVNELEAVKKELEENVQRLSSENKEISSQLDLTRKDYKERVRTLESNLRSAQQTIDELRTGVSPDVVLERHLFEPHVLIDCFLQIGHKKLTELVPLFESVRKDKEREIFERGIEEVGINLTFDEYKAASPEIRLPWEQTDLYKRLKPEYDEAVESVMFLNSLRDGTGGKDIPKRMREKLINDPENENYNKTIERFQKAEMRHRQLKSLSEVIARLHSQEKYKAIVDQPIVYIANVIQDRIAELYVPINDEIADTFLGSLLLSQLDKLGERIQPYKTFFRYIITEPSDVLRNQTEYGFYNLGIKVSLFSLRGDASPIQSVIEVDKVPMKQDETPKLSNGAKRLLETIKKLKEEGKPTKPSILEKNMNVKRLNYHHIQKLIAAGKIRRIKVGDHTEYDLI